MQISIANKVKDIISFQIKKIELKSFYPKVHNNIDLELHIKEAVNWLCRAQDWGSDRGVALGTEFGKGFMKSYPETTGYIIPTLIKMSEVYDNQDLLKRAIEMGDWEIEIQMESGAVMGGMVNDNPTPAIFNTGQVILGWNALYQKTLEERFLKAAKRAASWMVEMQETDGNWLKGNSLFAQNTSTLYNVRAAWALAQYGYLCGQDRFIQAAVKNAQFTLNHQTENGWFRNCCLDDPSRPLLHTIAYTMRGLLEIGILTDTPTFIDASKKTACSLLKLVSKEGFIPGRITPDFKPAVKYACLTGSAQASIIYSRLYKLTGEKAFKDAVHRINSYLMKHHDITSRNLSIRGGVAGSWPVHGEYGQFKVLNWATKFFIDALIEEKEIENIQ